MYGDVRVVSTPAQPEMFVASLLKVTDPGTDVVAVIVFPDP
jgi:hypothetical protein